MNRRTRRASLVLSCLLVLGVVAAIAPYLARANNSKQPGAPLPPPRANASLSSPYPYLTGDDIAHRMGFLFRVTAGLAPAALVDYDRKAKTIVVEIIGSAEKTDGAKREIEAFTATIKDRIVPYAKERHGMTLEDRDVTLIYFNDGGEGATPYEIVRRQEGKYVTPARESSEN
jgi:hypothetical protein